MRFGSAISPSSVEGTAVTGQEDGRGMLDALERGNLFVVPLDDKRQWYRYHHLFADVLQARVMKQQPDEVATLHRRASEWYEQAGYPADAIRHALAAEDFERARRDGFAFADLIVNAVGPHPRATLYRYVVDSMLPVVLRHLPPPDRGRVPGGHADAR